MNCCSAKGCDEFFTERVARRDAARYRRVGYRRQRAPHRRLRPRHGVEGSTVLEVGGGVGAIQLELLRAGAARAENVELSPAYEPYAAELLQEAGRRRTGRATALGLRQPGGRGPACRLCRPPQGRLLLPGLRGAGRSRRPPRQAPAPTHLPARVMVDQVRTRRREPDRAVAAQDVPGLLASLRRR